MRQPQFLVDALLVGVDRLGADEQLLADLGRAIAASDEFQDVLLALGELFEPGALVGVLRSSLNSLRQGTRRGRLHVDVTVGHCPHRIYELAVGGALDEVPACARLQQWH